MPRQKYFAISIAIYCSGIYFRIVLNDKPNSCSLNRLQVRHKNKGVWKRRGGGGEQERGINNNNIYSRIINYATPCRFCAVYTLHVPLPSPASLSTSRCPALFLSLVLTASHLRSLVCCCCLSKAKTFDYLPRHLCLLFRLTLNYSARCSQSTLAVALCCCPQLPPSAVSTAASATSCLLFSPLCLTCCCCCSFFIFHFIFRSFNFYLCK